MQIYWVVNAVFEIVLYKKYLKDFTRKLLGNKMKHYKLAWNAVTGIFLWVYFLNCAGLLSYSLAMCTSGRRGAVEGAVMPIQQCTAILVARMSALPARSELVSSIIYVIIYLPLHLVKAYPYKPLWNNTNKHLIRILLFLFLFYNPQPAETRFFFPDYAINTSLPE